MEFKVVGVSFENRQEILEKLYYAGKDIPVAMEPEPENEHDNNAIAVWCKFGKIGYVPRDMTSEARGRAVADYWLIGRVESILGMMLKLE